MQTRRARRAALAVVLLATGTVGAVTGATPAAAAPLVVSDLAGGVTPAQLVTSLLGGSGVIVSNITYTGSDLAAGTFTGGADVVGFDRGVILSSGRVKTTDGGCDEGKGVEGPNDCVAVSTEYGGPGDADLSALAGLSTFDASVLEFDFVPEFDNIQLRYVFSSDEYREFANSPFNDTFAFFVNGQNCALVPGTDPPESVSINTINNGDPFGDPTPHNEHLFVDNTDDHLDTEMDGLTVVLTCFADVSPGVSNHIKLAIADGTDDLVDSNVFLEAGSFVSVSEVTTVLTGGNESGPSITVSAGTSVTDQASINGLNAGSASGTIHYVVYSDSNCETVYADAGTFEFGGGQEPPSNSVTFSDPGTFYWRAHYSGDELNDPASSACGDEVLTVVPPPRTPTNLTYTGETTEFAGNSITLSAELRDLGGNVVADRTVGFAISGDGGCTDTTDAAGVASCTVPGLTAGTYTVNSSFAGDGVYEPSSDEDTLTINGIGTTLTYTGETTELVGNSITLGGTLNDQSGGVVAGRTVGFAISGDGGCSAVTDVAGMASCTVPGIAAGTYTVTSSFAGDGLYVASSDSDELTINKIGTTLTYTGETTELVGNSITLSGELRDQAGNVIAGKTVGFAISGDGGCTDTTDAAGVASCTVPGLTAGTYTVTSSFAGDDVYLASSDADTLTIGKIATTLTYTGETTELVGNNITLSGELRDQAGNVIAGKTVGFAISGDGGCSALTNAAGVASCTVPGIAAGTYTVDSSFAGDDVYLASSDADTLTINKIATTLTYIGETSEFVGNSITLSGELRDQAGNVIAGKTVGFAISGDGGCTDTTDAAGVASCTVPGLTAGTYTVTSSFAGDDVYLASSDADQLTINKIATTLTYTGETTEFVGNNITLSAVLEDQSGLELAGKTVSFAISGDGGCLATTDSFGAASCTVPGIAAGTYTVTSSFAGDTVYLASSDADQLTINKIATTLTYTGETTEFVDADITLRGTLKNQFGGVVAGRTVSFAISGDGSCSAVTDAAGEASCTVPGIAAGTYTVDSSFAGDDVYEPSSDEDTLTILRIATTLTYTGETTEFVDDDITLSGELRDQAGNVIAGRTVGFAISGDGGCSAVTNAAGIASCTVPGIAAGTYTVDSSFAGDAKYLPSSDEDTLTILRIATTLTYTGETTEFVDADITLSATLTDQFGKVIAGRTVDFAIGGDGGCSAVTNAAGEASCTVPGIAAGTYTVNSSFAGDAKYLPSSDEDTLTILRIATTLTYTGETTEFVDEDITLSGELRDQFGNVIAGRNIAFFLSDGFGCSADTNAAGVASCTVPGRAAGTYTVNSSFAGDAKYLPSSDEDTLTILRIATTLTYTGETTEFVDEDITLSGELRDQFGRVVAGRIVSFAIGGDGVCSAITDAAGVAACTVPGIAAGTYTVTSSFAGDAKYLPSSDEDTLTIVRVPTITEYVGDRSGRRFHPATLAAILTDGRDSSPIAGRTIDFTFDGAPACSGVTDATGFASCTFTPTQARGFYQVTASFAGDAKYLPSSDTESFFVIVPTMTGRAVAVAGVLPLLGPVAVSDTGPVATDDFPVLVRKYLVWLPGPLLNVSAADSAVQTRDGGVLASTQVAGANIAVAGLPVISIFGVASWSASSCEAPSVGHSSVGLLRVGIRQIDVNVPPNTTINLGAIRIVINEQIPFTTADGGRGLTVNAVHIIAPGVNLVVASATSDIHNCTAPPPVDVTPEAKAF